MQLQIDLKSSNEDKNILNDLSKLADVIDDAKKGLGFKTSKTVNIENIVKIKDLI